MTKGFNNKMRSNYLPLKNFLNFKIMVMALLLCSPPQIPAQISVSGILNDQNSGPIEGCTVSLGISGLSATTGIRGEFLIEGPLSVAPHLSGAPRLFSRLLAPVLHLENRVSNATLKISLADNSGKLIKTLLQRPLPAGNHEIDLRPHYSVMRRGVMFLLVQMNGHTEVHRVLFLDGVRGSSINTLSNLGSVPLAKKARAADSVSIHCDGFVDKEIELATYTDDLGTVKVYKPNVLFISVDDLNNWIGVLGGHPQTKTPNMDKLAGQGVLFEKAYCNGPICNPSRISLMTGIAPHISGVMNNTSGDVLTDPLSLRNALPNAVLIPQHFRNNGYYSAAAGKMLHYIADLPSWDEYLPNEEYMTPWLTKNGDNYTYPNVRPRTVPSFDGMYIEFDWGSWDMTDEEFKSDYTVTQWAKTQFSKNHTKPFFLGTGIYRPHLPWFAPKKYYDMHPLGQVMLPPGYKADDRDDLPSRAKNMTYTNYHDHVLDNDLWNEAVQAYLASISYADAMVGLILDHLDESEYRDNTMVVLWSDHGWNLGEKMHWRKFHVWHQTANVPLMFRVPKGFPGLPQGTAAGSRVTESVELLDLYKTLIELTGISEKSGINGVSLLPQLKDPAEARPRGALTQFLEEAEYAFSDGDWRYIHYRNDGEELYNLADDPHEWDNLAGMAEHNSKLIDMRTRAAARLK